MQGKKEEAIKSLKRFRGADFDPSTEIADLQREEEMRQSLNVREALRRSSSKKAMIICFGLMFFQQLSGINAVIFYTSTIFADANIELNPEIATIIIGVVQVIATLIATLTLDKLGRRLLLLVSDSLMALCTLILGIYSAVRISNKESVEGLGWLSLFSLSVFIIAFSLGFGPVPW
jgi:MFS family permease